MPMHERVMVGGSQKTEVNKQMSCKVWILMHVGSIKLMEGFVRKELL